MMRRFWIAAASVMMLAFVSGCTATSGSSTRGDDYVVDAHGNIISARDAEMRAERRARAADKNKEKARDAQKLRASKSQKFTLRRTDARKVSKRSKKRIAKRSTSKKKRISSRGSRSKYHKLIAKHARANGVPVALAHAVVRVESGYRANARGGVGEIGLMQLRPSTARGIGYRGSKKGLYNPNTNLKYGMRYLGKAYRLGKGNTCRTILKYNAGHGAKRMNPISARYCKRVRSILRGRK